MSASHATKAVVRLCSACPGPAPDPRINLKGYGFSVGSRGMLLNFGVLLLPSVAFSSSDVLRGGDRSLGKLPSYAWLRVLGRFCQALCLVPGVRGAYPAACQIFRRRNESSALPDSLGPWSSSRLDPCILRPCCRSCACGCPRPRRQQLHLLLRPGGAKPAAYKVGLINHLTGDAAAYGQSMKKGAELALTRLTAPVASTVHRFRSSMKTIVSTLPMHKPPS